MSLLEKAISLAVEVHQGQTDKAGRPYILHPLRVMAAVYSDEEKMAAVLHDVVEDSELTIDLLRQEGFPDTVVNAVNCLTRRDGEDYFDFIVRAGLDPMARKVKRADLLDNMDLTRIEKLTDKDLKRVAKYHRAFALLEERGAEPNKSLQPKAVDD